MNHEKSCGAVVFTLETGIPQYVLVLQHSGRRSFPKGHVENGETEHETALREIYEETGLKPHFIDGFRETETYPVVKKPDTDKQVVYFLAAYADQKIRINSAEAVDAELYPYEEALKLLERPAQIEILEKARAFIEALP